MGKTDGRKGKLSNPFSHPLPRRRSLRRRRKPLPWVSLARCPPVTRSPSCRTRAWATRLDALRCASGWRRSAQKVPGGDSSYEVHPLRRRRRRYRPLVNVRIIANQHQSICKTEDTTVGRGRTHHGVGVRKGVSNWDDMLLHPSRGRRHHWGWLVVRFRLFIWDKSVSGRCGRRVWISSWPEDPGLGEGILESTDPLVATLSC